MKIFLYVLSLMLCLITTGCDKQEEVNAGITTIEASGITEYSAQLKGEITLGGELTVLSRGFCWQMEPNPTIFDQYTVVEGEFGEYQFETQTLHAGKTYFARAFYINHTDTIYGNQIEFETENNLIINPDLEYGSVTDIDGNIYKTVTIGEQTWMVENLRTTRYQNGDPINHVTDLNNWGHFQISEGAYIYYNNDEDNKEIHGAHYNWHAASDSRNVAPFGWRVPTTEDWQKLIDHLDPSGNRDYGYKLRETTTAHWYKAENMDKVSTNTTGFTAIPSGQVITGNFVDLGFGPAYFWTSTGTPDGSSCIYLSNNISIDFMQPNARGFSIRCIKN